MIDTASDAVLRVVTEEIRAQHADSPSRLDDHEFVLLLPNMKAEAAGAYLDKPRVHVSGQDQEAERGISGGKRNVGLNVRGIHAVA